MTNHDEQSILLTEEGVEMRATQQKTDSSLPAISLWKQKLSSRKLWAAVIAALFALLTAFFSDSLSPESADMLKTGLYSLIAYIFGEGAVDAARAIGSSAVQRSSQNADL